MTDHMRQAVIRDLKKLRAEIPELIAAIKSGNDDKTREAIALVTKGSAGRFDFLMNKLTDYVVDEAMKGNKRPLRYVTSGEAFR